MLRICFFFLLFGCLSCHSTKSTTKQNHLLFSIEKGPCFGNCPQYKTELYSSGIAKFTGIRNVDYIGDKTGSISDSLIGEIENAIIALKVADLDSVYVNKYLTDFPATDLYFEIDGQLKHIHICHENPPQEIQKVIDVINTFENRIKWDFSAQPEQH